MPDDQDAQKLELERTRLDLDKEKSAAEFAIKKEELELKRTELEISKHSGFTGVTTALIAGIASLLAAGATASLGGFFSLETQRQKNDGDLAAQQRRHESETVLLRQRNDADATTKELDRRFQLVLKATENRTRDEAAANLLFFVDIGYLPDPEDKIRSKATKGQTPVFTSIARDLARSETAARLGIDNTPPPEAQLAFKYFEEKILAPVEKYFGKPVELVSGYRSPQLSQQLMGRADTAHTRGEGADIQIAGTSPAKIACWIKANLEFDELFVEPVNAPTQWVHVSIKKQGNRKLTTGFTC